MRSEQASGRWTKLDSMRGQHLARARKCAELTIPHLLPPEGSDENTPLETPYQGLGARASNNLASKLLLTLLPPNSPFFRLSIPPDIVRELQEALGAEDFNTQVQQNLATREKDIMAFIESEALRVPVYRLLRLLIVTGNCLTHYLDKGGLKVFRLDQYVVKRAPNGKVLEIVVKESIDKSAIPEEIKSQLSAEQLEKTKADEEVDLFTHIILNSETKYDIYQEICGVVVESSKGTYPEDKLPWKPMTWTLAVGEDYGRGHVEEHLGDFISLEGLTKAIVQGSAAAAKVLFLIDPNGMTNRKDLIKAKNCGFATGRKEDVDTLQVEKFNDFRTALSALQRIEERIAQAFLLHSSVQRNAERVTAEEVRYMAQELEDALGGIYSVLSVELQYFLLENTMRQMSKQGKLTALPKEVKPVITTGLEALGRGHDLAKLQSFAENIARLSPELINTYMNVGSYIKRVGLSLGIDMDGLIKTDDEIKAEQQQAEMSSLVASAAPGMATQATKGVMDAVNQPQPNQGE